MTKEIEYCQFYKSFYDAIKQLPKDKQDTEIRNLLDYCFEGVIPDEQSIIFIMAKPNIDSSVNSFLAGEKGGRPKKDDIQPEIKTEVKKGGKKGGFLTGDKNQEEDKDKDKEEKEEEDKEEKFTLGEYENVFLFKREKDKLISDLGEEKFNLCIKKLSLWLEDKKQQGQKDKYKTHNLVIRKWVIGAVEEDIQKGRITNPIPATSPSIDNPFKREPTPEEREEARGYVEAGRIPDEIHFYRTIGIYKY